MGKIRPKMYNHKENQTLVNVSIYYIAERLYKTFKTADSQAGQRRSTKFWQGQTKGPTHNSSWWLKRLNFKSLKESTQPQANL